MSNASEILCRACLHKCDLINEGSNFITVENGFESFKGIYTDLTSLQISDDDALPKCFCPKCTDLLEHFKYFKETCIQSDQSLRSNFVCIKEEIEDEINSLVSLKIEPLDLMQEYRHDMTVYEWPHPYFEIEIDSKSTPDKRKQEKKSSEIDEEKSDSEAEVQPKIRKKKDVRAFKCSFKNCGKLLKTKTSLTLHERIHVKSDVLTCDICSRLITNISSMRKHMITHKTGLKTVKNDVNVNFKCTFDGCAKFYRLQSNMESHMLTHESEITICKICNEPLSSIRGLMRHKKSGESGSKKLECPTCSGVFMSCSSLKIHMRQHEYSFMCEECGAAFYSAALLNQHKKNHNTTLEFKCDICMKACKSHRCLQDHKKKKHGYKKNQRTEKRTYKCLICDKALATEKNLFDHCRIVHTISTTPKDQFKCMVCDKMFTNKFILERHLNLHTGERKFACHICSKTFAHDNVLKSHLNFHSGERPVHCKICKKGFYKNYALKIHMNIHNRKLIEEGVQGITLFKYDHNKKKKEK